MSKRLRTSERLAAASQNEGDRPCCKNIIDEPAPSEKSRIMKKWWKEQRMSSVKLSTKIDEADRLLEVERRAVADLKEKNALLVRELSLCTTKLNEVQSRNCNLTNEMMKLQARAEILKGSGMPPTLRKETDRVSMLKMIRDAILFILNIIMYQTQPITRLRALCTVLF
jgi:FtsZ-binding cell division protein ZapB